MQKLDPDVLFDHIDLKLSKLRKVAKALKDGGEQAALDAFLQYLRRRRAVSYPAQDVLISSDVKRKEALARADQLAEHVFMARPDFAAMGYEPQEYGPDIDWDADPVEDNNWTACMHRFTWDEYLAAAYRATKKDDYVATWVDLTRDWIQKHPVDKCAEDFAYAPLQVGVRSERWCADFEFYKKSEAFPPDFLKLFLAAVYDQAEKTARQQELAHNNVTLVQANGLIRIGLVFPEFKEADAWYNRGLDMLVETVDRQVSEDGVQREWSINYHMACADQLMSLIRLLDRNKRNAPKKLIRTADAMCDYLCASVTPDRQYPMFSDARRPSHDIEGVLARGADLMDKRLYRPIFTDSLADAPAQMCFEFPDAGMYFMRSGWARDAVYMAIHNSPEPASGHDQPDNGTFELAAYGRWLMTDSGCYAYAHGPRFEEDREWFRRTAAHQTLTLDGKNSQNAPKHLLWDESEEMVTVVFENVSYPDLTHRRSVFFIDDKFFVLLDEALGSAEGKLDLHFQLAPNGATVDLERKQVHTNFEDANVLVWTPPFAPVEMVEEEGRTSCRFQEEESRPAVALRHEQKAPAAFLTVIVPYEGTEVPSVSAHLSAAYEVGDDFVEITVTVGERRWRLGRDLADGETWCAFQTITPDLTEEEAVDAGLGVEPEEHVGGRGPQIYEPDEVEERRIAQEESEVETGVEWVSPEPEEEASEQEQRKSRRRRQKKRKKAQEATAPAEKAREPETESAAEPAAEEPQPPEEAEQTEAAAEDDQRVDKGKGRQPKLEEKVEAEKSEEEPGEEKKESTPEEPAPKSRERKEWGAGAAKTRQQPEAEEKPAEPLPPQTEEGEEVAEPEEAMPPISFSDLSDDMREACERAGWGELMPVQAKAIPYMLAKRDLMVQSRTGSGKTAAFLLPIIHRIDTDKKACQALILVPTRELAKQVATEAEKLAGGSAVKTAVLYGGVGYGPQLDALRGGAQIVVGTPGRVLDHLLKRSFNLDDLDILVFDEADRMLSMGFYPDMREVQSYLPRSHVNAYMFSATFPPHVKGLATLFLRQPDFLSLSRDHVHVAETAHVYYRVPPMEKDRGLVRIIEVENPTAAIIFCNTRQRVHYVSVVLQRFGYDTDELSSDLSQKAREEVMGRLREGKLRFLVATDVAARGIDIPELSHIILFETPEDNESYIHRAGRTGRAGASGEVISLVNGLEEIQLERIAKEYGIDLQKEELPTEEEVQQVVAQRVTALLEAKLRNRDKLRVERMKRFEPLARNLVQSADELALIAMLIDDYYQETRHAPPPPPATTMTQSARQEAERGRGEEGNQRNKKRRGKRRRKRNK